MPPGRIHSAASVMLAAGLAASHAIAGAPPLPAAAGALAGVMLTPDHDLAPNYTYYIAQRVGGKPLRAIWTVLWKPYAAVLPHRGVSHLPVLGTATRVLYLLAWLAALEGVITAAATGAPSLTVTRAALVWLGSRSGMAALAGLAAADTLHALMDVIWTDAKREAHRWRRHRTTRKKTSA